jgi:hypothetical protein
MALTLHCVIVLELERGISGVLRYIDTEHRMLAVQSFSAFIHQLVSYVKPV